MPRMLAHNIGRFIESESSATFWVAQILGWTGVSVISFLSLTLWYNQPDWVYIAHNLIQSLLGIVLSTPLRAVYRRVWNYGVFFRFAVISLSVLIFSTLWAVIRVYIFEHMTGETGVWSEFGGWLFASIFVFLCWSAFYHVFKYYRLAEQEHKALLRMESLRNSEVAKAACAESAAREAQLTMLRYQLNPHFLFNTLNSIQSLVSSRRAEAATAMIASLSNFLRYSLYTDGKKRVTVDQELEAIDLYLQIEQSRFRDRLTVAYDVADEVRGELVPSMLLQPLVENAIKYAIAPSEQGGSVIISAQKSGGCLELAVTDSGHNHEGIPRSVGSGVGLRNIKQRLENSYGSDFSFQLIALETGGMRAEIRLPLG